MAARVDIRGGLDDILARLRSDYLKVDIARTSREAQSRLSRRSYECTARRKKAAKKRGKRK